MGGALALGFSKYQTKEGFIMKNSALVVIDLQNDITKNYREIIEKVNKAIDWAVEKGMRVIYALRWIFGGSDL